jgi:hypothetical protein
MKEEHPSTVSLVLRTTLVLPTHVEDLNNG